MAPLFAPVDRRRLERSRPQALLRRLRALLVRYIGERVLAIGEGEIPNRPSPRSGSFHRPCRQRRCVRTDRRRAARRSAPSFRARGLRACASRPRRRRNPRPPRPCSAARAPPHRCRAAGCACEPMSSELPSPTRTAPEISWPSSPGTAPFGCSSRMLPPISRISSTSDTSDRDKFLRGRCTFGHVCRDRLKSYRRATARPFASGR